jgi:hypothetical protein
MALLFLIFLLLFLREKLNTTYVLKEAKTTLKKIGKEFPEACFSTNPYG